jgi:hypothetical protein
LRCTFSATDFRDIAAGTYVADVISDARGSSLSEITIMVVKTALDYGAREQARPFFPKGSGLGVDGRHISRPVPPLRKLPSGLFVRFDDPAPVRSASQRKQVVGILIYVGLGGLGPVGQTQRLTGIRTIAFGQKLSCGCQELVMRHGILLQFDYT